MGGHLYISRDDVIVDYRRTLWYVVSLLGTREKGIEGEKSKLEGLKVDDDLSCGQLE